MDEMLKLMVLMSTKPVAPHIAGCTSSVSIFLIQA
jgi:hypothetical protein